MGADVPNEETVSSNSIYRGKVLHFKKMTVRLQSGKIYQREIVEHPGAVTLIPLIGDKVILIRQFRLPIGKAIYELPAGTISKGEDSEACAKREMWRRQDIGLAN